MKLVKKKEKRRKKEHKREKGIKRGLGAHSVPHSLFARGQKLEQGE